jgi:multidrug resistance efflux pump
MHPRGSGFIDSVKITEGARVGKGRLLFQIEIERTQSHARSTSNLLPLQKWITTSRE